MGKTVTRRGFLAGILATTSGAALANAPEVSLRPPARPGDVLQRSAPAAQDLVQAARLGAGKVGYVVADARTGQVLETMNPLLPQPPASVTKSFTALYALNHLGAGYRFRTRLMASGTVSGGRLNGDLTLVGGGDPTLTTDVLGDMARDLKAAGINEVRGTFKVFAGALPYIRQIDQSQPDHLGYNPAISGLNLNFNRVHFEWKRAGSTYEVSMEARAERYRPRVATARMEVVNRDLPVYTYAERQGRDDWTVARGALGNGGSRWLPVRHPDAYAADVFRTLARSHGIVLSAPRMTNAQPRGTVIVERGSDTLRPILRDMLKYSNNLTAEVVGLTATGVQGRRAQNLRGSAQQMGSWAQGQLGAQRARFVDHSGLGDASRVSARDMVQALVEVGPEGALKPLLKEIAFRDDNNRPLQNQPIEVRAKTGTLNFVSALAGYARSPGGRDLAFAVFSADIDHRAALTRGERERPAGARGWARRARHLQQQLIERWAAAYEA